MWITDFYLPVSCSQYCRRLSMKQPLLFSQEDMPGIRKRIYKELCDYRLNDWLTPRPCQMGCLTEEWLHKLFGILVFQKVQKACLLVWKTEEQLFSCWRAQWGAVERQISICISAKNYWCGPLLTHNRCWTHTDWLRWSTFHPNDQRTQGGVGLDLHAGTVPAWTNETDLWFPSLSGLNSCMAIWNWRVLTIAFIMDSASVSFLLSYASYISWIETFCGPAGKLAPNRLTAHLTV